VLGNANGPSVPISGTIPANGGKLFVDLLSTTYFVDTGDNVKLVWNNTPGAGAAFGGSDIIVDRVEFNETSGGTLFWEPGNTIQGDEVAPLQGGSINRNVACADTNSRVQDFSPDIENRQNNPPLAPNPICLQGLCAPSNQLNHITVLTGFPMTWTHIDPDGDPQTQAQPSIYTVSPSTLVWQTTVSGAAGTATFNGVLLACNDYELRVRTKDAFAYGPESILPFHTNCPPTGLNLRWPTNGWTTAAKSNQQVWWSTVSDLDAMDTHNYTYVIAEDLAFTVNVITQTTANNYSAPFTTQPSKQYFWKVNVSDGWGSQPYTSPYQFTTSAGATDPTVSAPTVDGFASGNAALNHLTNHVPLFGWTYTPGTGTQTAYHIVVQYASNSTVIWDQNTTGTSASVAYGGGVVLIDGTTYRFQVKVADSDSPAHWSDFSAWLSFHINAPPPAPTPSTPTNGASVAASTTQTVTWASGGADAEGDTVTYTYCVGTATPPYPSCPTTGTGITGTTSNSFTTTAGTKYFWAVKASDSFEESAYSAVWNFTATSVTANTPPSIVLTNLPATVDKNTQRAIQWTMSDTETTNANLVVFLNYTIGGGSPVFMARLVGLLTYTWSVPNAEANNVVINVTVIDEGGLKGWDQTAPFNIVTPTVITTTPDNTVLYIAIIIIIVVVVLLLLLLMKRKKPKEEEEAPAEEKTEEAPAEEEVAEEELVGDEAKPAAKAAPAAAAKTADKKPSGKTKECPSCGTIVSVTDKECFMCGAKL